jgi:hypothetical protein
MNYAVPGKETFVSAVPVEYVDGLMAGIGHLTQSLVPHMQNLYTIESMVDGFKAGTMVPWAVVTDGEVVAFIATEVFQCPLRKVLALRFGAAKDMASCIDLVLNTLEQHARDNGCSSVEISGRMGWLRALDKHGYEPAYVTLSKEI